MTEQSLEVFKEQNIVAYDPFRAQLKELAKWNSQAVFDYESEKGNKEARSHIYKLRQTKSAVDKVRKDQKQAALDYGRRVDGQAKEIIGEIESMIEIHETPIKAIEQREKDRIAAHQANMERIQQYADMDWSDYNAERLEGMLRPVDELEPNESYEEFTAPALSIWKQAKERIEKALEARLKYEAEQAELQRLRAEQEECERKEREAKIAQEAAEKARQEAEEKAQREREESERKAQVEREAAAKREADARAAQEAAERARIEAEERAKRDAEEAEKRRLADIKAAEERAKAEAEAAKLAEEEAAKKRENDKKHYAKINNEAKAAFIEGGLSDFDAQKAVTMIAKGVIPNVSIRY